MKNGREIHKFDCVQREYKHSKIWPPKSQNKLPNNNPQRISPWGGWTLVKPNSVLGDKNTFFSMTVSEEMGGDIIEAAEVRSLGGYYLGGLLFVGTVPIRPAKNPQNGRKWGFIFLSLFMQSSVVPIPSYQISPVCNASLSFDSTYWNTGATYIRCVCAHARVCM